MYPWSNMDNLLLDDSSPSDRRYDNFSDEGNRSDPKAWTMDDYLYPVNGSKTNLIVNYLPADLTQKEFEALFSRIGRIDSSALMKNDDGTSRCFGFVKYFDPEDALRAIKEFDGFVLQGKKLKIRYARPGGSRAKCKLFVGNLPVFWTDTHLKYAFEEFGEILELKVLRNDDGRTRRCGFVRYDEQYCAQHAIHARNGWIPPGTTSKLRVHVAHPNARKQSKRVFMQNGSCVTLHHQTPIITGSRADDGLDNMYAPAPCPSPNWNPPPREYMRSPYHSPVMTEPYAPYAHPRSILPSRESSPDYSSDTSNSQTLYVWNLPTFLSQGAIENMFVQYGGLKDVSLHCDVHD